MKKYLIIILRIIFFSYLGLCALYFFLQTSYIFFPTKTFTPPPMGVEEVFIDTRDGEKLHAWWMDNKAGKTVLFFHGNAGNLTDRAGKMEIFKELGFNALMFDYRSYGKSSGKIKKENDLYIDGQAAYDYLLRNGVDEKNIIIWGRSLGAAIGIYTAQGRDISAMIIESTFSSMESIGRHHYWYLPVKLLLRYKFNSINKINNIKAPLLIIHSTEDKIIPFAEGQLLFSAYEGEKEMIRLKGRHNSDISVSYKTYISGLKKFLINEEK